jgi:ribosomal-protein-alanine N-acetyltransferase
MTLELRTERLRLVPCPPEWHPEDLEATLGVSVPGDWPLQDLREILPDYADLLSRDDQLAGWGPWLMIDTTDTVVGDLGFTGKPDLEGDVEIGYSVLPAYRGNRYASEAVVALVAWAMAQPTVSCVEAACASDNAPSIRVLGRAGFRLVSEQGGTLRYELRP